MTSGDLGGGFILFGLFALHRQSTVRDRYVFQIEVDDEAGHIGLLVDAGDVLTLEWGEQRSRAEDYPIPWDQPIAITVEITGTEPLWAVQLYVDGILRAESIRASELRPEMLGHVTLGARHDRQLGAAFAVQRWGGRNGTFPAELRRQLIRELRSAADGTHRFVEFSGDGYLRSESRLSAPPTH